MNDIIIITDDLSDTLKMIIKYLYNYKILYTPLEINQYK